MRTLGITTPVELRQADHKAVIAWERFMRETEHAAASTIRRRLAALSSLYKHLVRHSHAARNPVGEVERPALNRDEGSPRKSRCSGDFDVTLFAHGLQSRPRPKMANRCNKFAGGVMDDPTACWHRYLVSISALEPDEDEATQALTELIQWLRVGGRPPDGFTAGEIRALVARLW